MWFRYFTLLVLVMVSPIPAARGSFLEEKAIGPKSRVAKIEKEIFEQKRELAAKKKELAKLAKDLAKAKIRAKGGARAKPDGLANKTRKKEKAAPDFPVDTAEMDELLGRSDELKSEIGDLKKEIEDNEEKIERLESAIVARPVKKENCQNCESRISAPNQGKSAWEGVADVIKAATPLGLGGMNTWLGYQGMKAQSSDYRLYNSVNSAAGLPSQAPSGYGNIMSSYAGSNSMLAMAFLGGGSSFGMSGMNGMGNIFGMNGMGAYGGMSYFMPNMYGSSSGYGMPSYSMGYSPVNYAYSGFGGAYMSPYSSYGANAFGYNGMSYYNPYGVAYYGQYNSSGLNSFYQNQLTQNQTSYYAAQQRAILGQDAQVAQQSLNEAYGRYNYVMQQMGGISSATAPAVSNGGSQMFNSSAVPSFAASLMR